MIKESGRLGVSQQEESHANIFNQSEYETQIVQLQEQIETLNEKLIESSFLILEQKQAIKKLEMQDKEKESKIKSLNQKIELINKAQKDKRNRHLKEIYNIKKTTYMALQKFVNYPIYDEKDENFYDFESNVETILEQIITQSNPVKKELQIKDTELPQVVCKFIDDYLNFAKLTLNQKPSFCKNIEDNKAICAEIQILMTELKRNTIESQLQHLLILQQKLSQVIV